MLERLGAPVTADLLEPFVEPSVCVASLTGRDDTRDDTDERQPGAAGTR